MSSGKPQTRSGEWEHLAFEGTYPSITRWVTAYGWVEVGPTEFSSSFVRALDMGGMVWEGQADYASLDEALHAMEAALAELLRKEFGER